MVYFCSGCNKKLNPIDDYEGIDAGTVFCRECLNKKQNKKGGI
jgi:DNA-directed RNA polymerase subunit RPC12/RpoP